MLYEPITHISSAFRAVVLGIAVCVGLLAGSSILITAGIATGVLQFKIAGVSQCTTVVGKNAARLGAP